jgi:hypothetical protein
MLFQRRRVSLSPQLAKQLRRTLDIRKDEGHSPNRRIGHPPSISQ